MTGNCDVVNISQAETHGDDAEKVQHHVHLKQKKAEVNLHIICIL